MSFHDMMVFTGNANAKLAHSVVEHLSLRIGKAQVSKFSDQNIFTRRAIISRGRQRTGRTNYPTP